MTEEQNTKLNELIQKYKTAQSEKRQQELKDQIYSLVRPLIEALAKKKRFRQLTDIEDSIQDGALGFTVALERFDSSIGTRFTTFMYSYVQKFINEGALLYGVQPPRADIDASISIGKELSQIQRTGKVKEKRNVDPNTLRILKRVRQDMSFNGGKLINVESIFNEEGEVKENVLMLSGATNTSEQIDNQIYIEQLLEKAELTKTQEKLLDMVYFQGLPVRKISGELKITQEKVKEVLERILHKIAKHK